MTRVLCLCNLGKGAQLQKPKIDPVTMVRIKASANLEQAIHKGEQAGPLADTLQIIVITDKINSKKRNTFLDNGLKSWRRTTFWNLILFLRGWESWWKDGSWPGETLTRQTVMAGLQFTFIIDEPHWYDGTPHGADGSVLTSKAGFFPSQVLLLWTKMDRYKRSFQSIIVNKQHTEDQSRLILFQMRREVLGGGRPKGSAE